MSPTAIGIDAGERLVEQHEGRPAGERPGDLDSGAARRPTAPIAAFLRRWVMWNSSSRSSSSRSRFLRVGLDHLQHRADVLLDREAAEDRGLLRQVADAEAGAAVHRQLGDVVAVEVDHAAVGLIRPVIM
jgi:hypothetical protein